MEYDEKAAADLAKLHIGELGEEQQHAITVTQFASMDADTYFKNHGFPKQPDMVARMCFDKGTAINKEVLTEEDFALYKQKFLEELERVKK
jgi:hypothetical protein